MLISAAYCAKSECGVGYYAIDHGAMKLMIAGYSVYSFSFIITQRS